MHRAINEQTLVGNIGGYLGLFLGYSILQLPNMIQILSMVIIDRYRQFKSGNRRNEDIAYQIHVREKSNNFKNRENEYCQLENTISGIIEVIQKMEERIEARFSKIEEKIENAPRIAYDKPSLSK